MPDITIDDGLHTVTVGDAEYRIDLIAVSTKIGQLVDKHKDSRNFAHLGDFIAYMREVWEIELRPGQAERFWQDVVIEVQRQKKEYTDALNSLTHTQGSDSTPEE